MAPLLQRTAAWTLEHHEPAAVRSTTLDLFEVTSRAREKKGAVHVWDPFAGTSASWTPIEGCEDWGAALRQGHWLADAVGEGEHPAVDGRGGAVIHAGRLRPREARRLRRAAQLRACWDRRCFHNSPAQVNRHW